MRNAVVPGALADAMETLEEKTMVLCSAMLGADGTVRIWLHGSVQDEAGAAWVTAGLMKAICTVHRETAAGTG